MSPLEHERGLSGPNRFVLTREMVSLETVTPSTTGDVRGHLTGGQTLGGQRQHDFVDTGQEPLVFLDDLRLKRRCGVPGHFDLHGTVLGEHGLGPGAVARVPGISADRIVLVIPQVLGQLRVLCLRSRC